MLIVEKEYSTHEILMCQQLFNQIVVQHRDCDGTGLQVVKDKISDCTCKSTYDYLLELIYARLPRGFWNVSLKQIKNLLHKDHIDFAAKLTTDFKLFSGVVMGNPLTGKTSFLTIVGKLAILNKRNVMYITPEDIIQGSKQDADKIFLNRLIGMDLVLLDGIENFNLQYDNQVLLVESTLKKLTDRGVQVIVTTGLLPDQIKSKLPEGLETFLKKLSNIFVTDLRKNHYENLYVEDYLDSELSKESQKYFSQVY